MMVQLLVTASQCTKIIQRIFQLYFLAFADSNWCFVAIDMGATGREGDNIIFSTAPRCVECGVEFCSIVGVLPNLT